MGLEIPRYRIVREIGRGAMGVVYESEHAVLGRHVALKLLHPNLRGNATATARFVREGRVAARLRHPHVIEVLDAETCDAGPFLVMEYVEGPTLAENLHESRAIAPERAVELVLPILSALMHAHAAGVVHRDVKPANILLARDRFGDLVPKIGDFGLGKWLDDSVDRSLTRDGVVGSLPYMAPEQVREAKAVDARADQYSLAVLVYEAVAGRLPFEAAGAFALMEAICAGRAAPLARVAAGVPAAFAEVIQRSMSVRVEDRYPSLMAMGRDLIRFSSGRSWAIWAREFRAPSVDSVGATLDDMVTLAARAKGAPGPKRRDKSASRRVLVPLLCFGFGATCASAALRAPREAVKPQVSASAKASASRPLPPATGSLAGFDESLVGGRPPASSAETLRAAAPTTRPTPAARLPPGPARPARPSTSGTQSGPREFGGNNAPILE